MAIEKSEGTGERKIIKEGKKDGIEKKEKTKVRGREQEKWCIQ